MVIEVTSNIIGCQDNSIGRHALVQAMEKLAFLVKIEPGKD